MLIPKVFFQSAKFVDPLSLAITKTEGCIKQRRGILRRTILDEILKYVKHEIKHKDHVIFNEEWISSKIFTTSEHDNPYITNMVGVFPQHDKSTLFQFAREISDIVKLQGFKNEIVEYLMSKLLTEVPVELSNGYRVKQSDENYIITKK